MDNKGCDCVENVSGKVSGQQHPHRHEKVKRTDHHHHHRDRDYRHHRHDYRQPADSRNTCNCSILHILVLIVALVAIAGLVFGIFIWRDIQQSNTGDNSGNQRSTTRIPFTRMHPRTTDPLPPAVTEGPEVCLNRRTEPSTCPSDSCSRKYRTYDGTCNNHRYPLWGASEVPFHRLLQPIYEDGVNTPVGWNPYRRYNGYLKPSPRLVSQEILKTHSINPHERFTDLVMVWGQYFDHDVDHTPKTDGLCTEYCTQKAPYCFPAFAPDNDARLPEGGCVPVTRSLRVCNLEPREQLNSITSYIDASTVYGSTKDRALDLRDLTNDYGHLREGISVGAGDKLSKPMLPFVDTFVQACDRPMYDNTGIPCFFAGDVRANEHVGLVAVHTIWVREHNRIADELRKINPQWNGETLYQEARRIVGALHQIITLEHWLPKIVGTKGIELLGPYNGYEPYVDATTVNSFATAAFRFGHAQISPTVTRLGPDFQETAEGNIHLHDAAFCPFRVVNEGGCDPVLRGMFAKPLKDIDSTHIMTDEVTENLFEMAPDVAHDLASLNIQRGRDHGLPGYNQWRQFCNLPIANTFDDLADVISNIEVRQKLEYLYGHPDNVDLFVAGLAEDAWYDSVVGPTFTCLIVHQFKSWRAGDRFWYEDPLVFTDDQRAELRRHSLARIFCDSGDDIQHVQPDVFKRATYPYGYKPCNEIPGMDLTSAWKDTGSGSECS